MERLDTNENTRWINSVSGCYDYACDWTSIMAFGDEYEISVSTNVTYAHHFEIFLDTSDVMEIYPHGEKCLNLDEMNATILIGSNGVLRSVRKICVTGN